MSCMRRNYSVRCKSTNTLMNLIGRSHNLNPQSLPERRPLADPRVTDTALVCRTLGDEDTLSILCLISSGTGSNTGLGINVKTITDTLQRPATNVSRRLKQMTLAGLVHRQRREDGVFYSLRGEALRSVADWINELLINTTTTTTTTKDAKP